MAEKPPVIRVPRTSRGSYQPHRPLSKNKLLQGQVKRFREIEKHFDPEHQSAIAPGTIETEGQAAAYIRHVTRKRHMLADKA